MPSKEEIYSKLLFLMNAPAQRLVTVMNAIGRDLAVVINQGVEKNKFAGGKKPPARRALGVFDSYTQVWGCASRFPKRLSYPLWGVRSRVMSGMRQHTGSLEDGNEIRTTNNEQSGDTHGGSAAVGRNNRRPVASGCGGPGKEARRASWRIGSGCGPCHGGGRRRRCGSSGTGGREDGIRRRPDRSGRQQDQRDQGRSRSDEPRV